MDRILDISIFAINGVIHAFKNISHGTAHLRSDKSHDRILLLFFSMIRACSLGLSRSCIRYRTGLFGVLIRTAVTSFVSMVSNLFKVNLESFPDPAEQLSALLLSD